MAPGEGGSGKGVVSRLMRDGERPWVWSANDCRYSVGHEMSGVALLGLLAEGGGGAWAPAPGAELALLLVVVSQGGRAQAPREAPGAEEELALGWQAVRLVPCYHR